MDVGEWVGTFVGLNEGTFVGLIDGLEVPVGADVGACSDLKFYK